MAVPENKSTASSETPWVPGAEPVALCMSCSTAFPLEAAECPNCHLGLSLVRKCPECRRVQSMHHLRCIYCSSSFVPGPWPEPKLARPLAPPTEVTRRRVPPLLTALVGLGAILTPILYIRLRPSSKPEGPIGQSYVLRRTSLRLGPSFGSAQIKDTQPPEVVDILDDVVDAQGNRWFRISSQGVQGYVQTRELGPPKGTDPEKTFNLLQHSLLALDDPSVLPDANAAADYYQKAFPKSPHIGELRWLLAERTRQLAEHSARQQALMASAREQYTKIAQGNGEFAEPAREALAHLPPAQRGSKLRQPSTPSTFGITVVGGSLISPHPSSPGSPGTLVRRLTVLSETSVLVRLTEPVRVSPGATFQGVIDEAIFVDHEIAVPKGSLSHLTLVNASTASSKGNTSALTPRLMTLVIEQQTYQVSAEAIRIEPPAKRSTLPPAPQSPPELLAGTRIVFRLNAPLVVMHP